MTVRVTRAIAAVLAFTVLAVLLAPGLTGPTAAQAGGDQAAKAGKPSKAKPAGDDGAVVQQTVLRWRDGWSYGLTDPTPADSAHAEGELAAGEVTLHRSAAGIRLEVRDHDAIKNHAYSIWFQICPFGTGFKDNDTQCVASKLLNMNGNGGVAGPHGLSVDFELATGTLVGPRNVCDVDDPRWHTEPCPAWGIPGVLVGDVVFTSDMALHAPVRIVVKDHGPTKNVKDVGKLRGLKTQQALFTATHRTDSPDCQPARPVCPDAHVAVFAELPAVE